MPVPVDDASAVRCGSQCAVSRFQLSLSDAGQTTIAGKASSASSAASAWTVLPRPCSSARNVRRACEHVGDAGALERAQLAAEPRPRSSSGGAVVGARAAHVVDRRVVLAAQALQRLARVGRDLDPERAQVVLQRLEQVGVDGQRAAVRLAGREREEGGHRVRVPVDVEREARLADALDQRERGGRGLLADLQARTRSACARGSSRAPVARPAPRAISWRERQPEPPAAARRPARRAPRSSPATVSSTKAPVPSRRPAVTRPTQPVTRARQPRARPRARP